MRSNQVRPRQSRPTPDRTARRPPVPCQQVDPEVFFPPPGSDGSEAKAICSACPVQAECQEWALAITNLYGVWGGLTQPARERQQRRRRKRR